MMNEGQASRWKQTMGQYVPPMALEPLFVFLTETNVVRMRVRRERSSKLGDYRCPQPRHQYHEISVNGNLNPYFFLWVLLHEMAHLETWKQHHNTVPPHGHEWQEAYRQLIVAYAGCFPEEIRPLLERYTRRIPLPRPLMQQIEERLRGCDEDYTPALTLAQLPEGSRFRLLQHPDRVFRSVAKRRTRWLCEEISTHRNYLVSGNAPVEQIG